MGTASPRKKLVYTKFQWTTIIDAALNRATANLIQYYENMGRKAFVVDEDWFLVTSKFFKAMFLLKNGVYGSIKVPCRCPACQKKIVYYYDKTFICKKCGIVIDVKDFEHATEVNVKMHYRRKDSEDI